MAVFHLKTKEFLRRKKNSNLDNLNKLHLLKNRVFASNESIVVLNYLPKEQPCKSLVTVIHAKL